MPRAYLLAFILLVVGCAEPLNTLAAANWSKITKQDYFDKRGVFAGVLLCGPLLLYGVVLLCVTLADVSGMLVRVKRQELVDKKRKKE